RKHRAELKLARVATQVERARDLEEEVRKRLRPLALQATAAERAEKLRGEIASLQARIAQLDLQAFDDRLASAEERRTAATLARAALEAASAAQVAAVEREARAERARQASQRLLARERSLHADAHNRLEALLSRRASVEEELTDAAGERDRSLRALCRLRNEAGRLTARRESAVALAAKLRAELAEEE